MKGVPEPSFGPEALRARLKSMMFFFFLAYFMLVFVFLAATYSEAMRFTDVVLISTLIGAVITAVDYNLRSKKLSDMERRLRSIVGNFPWSISWWGFIGSAHPLLVVKTKNFSILAQDTSVWFVLGGSAVRRVKWGRKVGLRVYVDRVVRQAEPKILGKLFSSLFARDGLIEIGLGQTELPQKGEIVTYNDAKIVEQKGLKTHFHRMDPEDFSSLLKAVEAKFLS